MGYVFDFHDAGQYDAWFSDPAHQRTFELEKELLDFLLPCLPGTRILDIGCGTGRSLEHFLQKGLDATGLDPSPYMLDQALARLGTRARLVRGFGEDLQFDDNSFDVASLVTTLEFVDNPQSVLSEACRVAKDHVLIGCLNRYALKGISRRISGMFSETVYNHARFFSLWDLKDLVRETLGDVKVRWRSTCVFPETPTGRFMALERRAWMQRSPFGAFLGMSVPLVPRFRTRTLNLGLKANAASPNLVAGSPGSLSGSSKRRAG